jgi:hypothetical protein
MSYLDLAAFRATPLVTDPFPFLVVPHFLRPEGLDKAQADYPAIDKPGSFPPSELRYGPGFAALLAELEGAETRAAFAEKFAIDLEGRPTMITVRGRTRAKDGAIHADSATKIITVLLYMNGKWDRDGGRLRLLRSPDSLENPILEVPPDGGTLLAFKVSPNSWHGHESFTGPRRTIQLNWVTNEDVVRHEQARHRFSARLKKLVPFA